ncbi:hypothetical protein JX265_008354 [Neoarthrinium moseri]|uniref:SnoaL-like domain-containing protein n=1 Tax=Neoarthrinium moseri TaxID=1658444 RepID=A0A9Q0ANM9_9PEZI|nr:uncharacterized protein JN550_011328 [Neoarthrinium moseri]KAI1860727.1 hypothetical protein JN550_011328 [Neoarthrinium moseri]KAI1864630.1 hypothetical protein JX265_008354 [Neoarthrinium moseri]
MSTHSYKYKAFVERGIDALNANNMEAFLNPSGFSAHFIKYLLPQSMNWPPQTREEWYEDLKSGFVGQNYVEWKVTIQSYWEDTRDRSAIIWCTERGTFVGDRNYEMDYVMRYKFDEEGKLLKLWELTDSHLQKSLENKHQEKGDADNDEASLE